MRSTDEGATWHRAPVARLNRNAFAVGYVNPRATATAHTMSIRVAGVDSEGRRVMETAIDAYRLVTGSQPRWPLRRQGGSARRPPRQGGASHETAVPDMTLWCH